MKKSLFIFTLGLGLIATAQAQLFSDDFTRASDPGSLRSWTAYLGPWVVTNGVMKGGPNPSADYCYAYTTTNRFTNFTAQARIQFPAGAFGGGLGGRMDTNSGSHYAAWIYPEGSGGGSTMFKLIRFDGYRSFTVLTNTTLSSVGTNFHTVKLEFSGSQINATFDTNLVMSTTDATYSSGALSLDMYSDANIPANVITVDDVLVPSLVPTAANDNYTMSQGGTLTVAAPGVLGNDTGGSGPLTAVQGVGPTHGTVSLSANGGFTYTPTNNYAGGESFTYRASDGVTNSPLATVTITINTNHVPVANDESYSLLTNTTLTVAAPGVLANDTDADSNPLTAVLVAAPLHGTFSLNSNGSFTFTPTNNYVGADSFVYKANDGVTNSGFATVSFTVVPAINLFYDNFTRSADPTNLSSPWVVSVGNWSVTGGQLKGGTNLPSAGYGFAYLTNRLTNYVLSAQVKFPVGAFGGGIGGRWDTNTGAHYAAWIYPDSSPGGADQLKILKFTGASNAAPFSILGSPANVGLLGTNFHALKLAFAGTSIGAYLDGALLATATDPTLSSGLLASLDMWTDTAPYVMGVDDVTAKSLAIDDSYTVATGGPTTVAAPGVLANDTGVSSTNLTATLATGPAHGTLTLNADGSFAYTATNNYTGSDTFTYQASDGTANLGTATVNLTVIPDFTANTAPTLGTQTNRTIVELSSLTVNNGATDSDLPANTLTYSLSSANVLGATNANVAISGAGVITWTPTEAQGPSTNIFITVVTDDGIPPMSATNSFIVVVQESNSPPVFTLTPANRTVNELSLMTVNNGATDSDLPANTLTYSLTSTNVLGATNANVAISGAGVITWTPSEAQGPSTNYFITRVTDNGSPSFSITNTFTVVVSEVNSAPTLPAQTNRTILPLTSLTITNTASDTNIPAVTLTYTLTATNAAGPVDGASISTNGIITWTPSTAQDQTTNVFSTIVSNFNPIAVNAQGLTAINTFTVVVNGRPVVVTNSASLIAESCVSTNNAIDPGETVTVAFSFKNIGLVNTANLVVTLLETNGISSPSSPQPYLLLAGGAPATNQFTFTAGGTCGASITATFQLQDGATNFGTATVPFTLGALSNVFSENFDGVTAPALPAGWTTTNSGLQSIWVTQTTARDTLPNAASATDGANVGISELVSPAIVLPGGASTLNFKNNYNLETGVGTNGFDGGVLEIKIGSSTNYVDITNAGGIFLTGGYTSVIDYHYLNPLSNRAAWSGNSGGFITTSVILPASAAGQSIQLRWRCATDNGNGSTAVAWRIDTLSISSRVCCANSAPLLPPQTNQTIPEGALLQITNTVTSLGSPANPVNYALLAAPANATIDTNGVITWTPTEAQGPSTNIFTTGATNSGVPSLYSTNSFTVIVTELNSAPVLPATTNYTIAELTSLTVTNTATDGDLPANTLSYTLSASNDGGPVTNAAISPAGVITWTPTEAQGPSTNTFTTIVTDDGSPNLSATNSFTVVVYEVNIAPTLPAQTNFTIAELTPLTVTNSAADPDIPANLLTYALTVSNAAGPVTNASISSLGVITWLPTEDQGPSTNVFTTVVTDFNPLAINAQNLSATNTFTVVVAEINSAPAFTQTPTNQTINELTTLTVTNAATDSDLPANTLSYALSVTSAAGTVTNANISANGVITWTPTEAQGPSTNTFTTIVTDNGSPNLSATNTFTVVVNEVNSAPAFTQTPANQTINELTTLTATNAATDTDLPANTLSYTLSVTSAAGPVTNASISSLGVITWLPTEDQGPSTNVFTTVVTDFNPLAVNAQNLSATNTFTVVVTEVNSAPAFTQTPSNQTINELTILTVTNAATDSDIPAETLAYTLSVTSAAGPVTNANISASGVITWTPTEAQGPSTNTFTTIVTDNGSPNLSATNTFTVVVNEVNSAPAFTQTPADQTINELSTLTVTNAATDSDIPANTLSYTLSVTSAAGPVTNPNISASGVITWTPSEAQGPSTNTFTTVITDNGSPNLSATNSFTVVVNEVNSAPAFIQTPSNHTINELTSLTVTNSATDSDIPANALSYTLSVTSTAGPVTNANISASGVITWTPSEAQGPSTNTFTTVITDNGSPNLSATNTFTVVVNEVNSAPAFTLTPTSQTINELATLTVTNAATDADLPANTLSYTLSVTSAAGPVANANISASGVITWTPSEAQGPSTNTFTTIVTDNGSPNLSATNTFTVVVNEVNSAPTFNQTPADQTINELTSLSATNAATDADLPANTLSYTLSVTSAVGPVTNANISASGVITWTPSEAQGPSTNTFTTIVTDNGSPNLSATNTFTVVVNEVNSAPTFTQAPADQTINELTSLSATNAATDADLPANTLSYTLSVTSAVGPVTNANISASGVITWTPSEAQGPSTNTFTTVITDNGSPNLSATNSFTVVVNEVNSAPVLPEIPDRTIYGLATLVVTNTATDSDLPVNALSYALEEGPSSAVISASGVITWTPVAGQLPSTNVFTTIVTDTNPWAVNAQSLRATNHFTVVAAEPSRHRGPVLPEQISRTIWGGQTLLVINQAFDDDIPTPILTYSLLSAPTNAVIDSGGVITWTPTSAQTPSVNEFTTVVTDDFVPSLSATNTFTVYVQPTPSGLEPIIHSLSLSDGVATLSWSALSNRTYRLQYKDALENTNWTDVAPDVVASGSTASGTNVIGSATQRLYRVMLLP